MVRSPLLIRAIGVFEVRLASRPKGYRSQSTPVIRGPHHGQLLPVEEWMRPGDCCTRHIEEKSRPMPRDIFEASPGAAFRRFTYRLVLTAASPVPLSVALLAPSQPAKS